MPASAADRAGDHEGRGTAVRGARLARVRPPRVVKEVGAGTAVAAILDAWLVLMFRPRADATARPAMELVAGTHAR